jgi:hypothetical protein
MHLTWRHKDAFILSAVLYLDDSDLFHMAIGMPLDEEFLQLVQSTTNDWAGLVHATEGLLKPQKCFWYILGWIWKKDKARLKTRYDLPQNPLYIPQPDRIRVPIQLKAISDPEKNVVSCKHGTQNVCMVNEVHKYQCLCKTVESVHAAVETQRGIFC